MSNTMDLVRQHLHFTETFQSRQVIDGIIDRCLENGRIASLGNRYKYNLPSSLTVTGLSKLDLRDRLSFIRRLQSLRDVIEGSVKEQLTESLATDDYSGYASPNLGFKTADLVVRVPANEISDYAGIKSKDLPTVFPMFDWDDYESDRTIIWRAPAHAGDTLLAKSYNEALIYALRCEGYSAQLASNPITGALFIRVPIGVNRMRFYDDDSNAYFMLPVGGSGGIAKLVQLSDKLQALRPGATEVWAARTRILNEMQRNAVRVQASSIEQSFLDYWDRVKHSKRALVQIREVEESWEQFPTPVSGSSSRTWGIEVEVVANNYISGTPSGWDSKSDGSLSAATNGDDCECSCDDCEAGEHYCGYEECEGGDTAEYVSPILRSTRSRGLNQLCTDLKGAPCNDTPGIHVHVGGDGLTVADFARLAVAYSAVSPFIEPLLHRNTREYCRDITTANIQHWLQVSRNVRRRVAGQSDSPLDAVHAQPDSRYVDLNFRAMENHGTVEFRAMGPYYNYDHLIKWAWFCREMVNVSTLDLPTSTWTSCKSLADVLKVLTTYGAESELIADDSVLSV